MCFNLKFIFSILVIQNCSNLSIYRSVTFYTTVVVTLSFVIHAFIRVVFYNAGCRRRIPNGNGPPRIKIFQYKLAFKLSSYLFLTAIGSMDNVFQVFQTGALDLFRVKRPWQYITYQCHVICLIIYWLRCTGLWLFFSIPVDTSVFPPVTEESHTYTISHNIKNYLWPKY